MGTNPTKFMRPGPESSPCLAVLDQITSKLKLVSLSGETSREVKISDHISLGIVTVNGQVCAVDTLNILKVNSDGTATVLVTFARGLGVSAQVVSFQRRLYVIESKSKGRMLRYNPADKTVDDDLFGCQLGGGFCCCASEDFIYAMGGFNTLTSAKKYDPLTNTWSDIERMKYERLGSGAAALGNRIYVLGGMGNPPPEFYDPQTSTWNEISNMNVDRWRFNACVINNQLYAVGGDFGEKQQSVEVYDGSRWYIVANFKSGKKLSSRFACVWPHGLETSESLREKKTVKRDSQFSESATGTVPDGAVGGKVKNGILAQILTKGEEVLVLCYCQQYDEMTRMTAHLTVDKLFKQVNTLPIPVCNQTDTSIKLQLEVYPPNEGNVVIHPPSHDVDIEGIRRGPAASFTFLCKSNKPEVDIPMELRVMKGNDMKSKHPFSFKRHRNEKSALTTTSATGFHLGDNATVNIYDGGVNVEAKT